MKRRVLLFTVALLVALAGTGSVFAYVKKADARAVSGQTPVKVYVATALIPAGTGGVAAKAMMTRVEMPRNVLPSGALADLSSIAGQSSSGDIYPGQVVVAAAFSAGKAVVGPLSIPTNKVAMSVELQDKQRVAGFLQPGAEVTIYGVKDFDKASALTRVLVARATVLAVGPTAAKGRENTDKAGKNGAGGPVLTTVLTVAVTMVEGEYLAHASTIGTIYFALLSNKSDTSGSRGPVSNDSVFGRAGARS